MPWQSDADLADRYARCQALLFPGEEDFGISPLECMASGRPVIALGRGGALETVIDGGTGVLVPSTDPGAWAEILRHFDASAFDPAALRTHALGFDRSVYAARMRTALAAAWSRQT